jgi:hypothetical protein
MTKPRNKTVRVGARTTPIEQRKPIKQRSLHGHVHSTGMVYHSFGLLPKDATRFRHYCNEQDRTMADVLREMVLKLLDKKR